MIEPEKEKTMNSLERLEKQKQEMIQRQRRDRERLDNEILKAKERIKKEKEEEKRRKEAEKQKEQRIKQNNLMSAQAAYADFVKKSMPITEINKVLDELLN